MSATQGSYHHFRIKLFVRQWIPGGRILLRWQPVLPSIEQLNGARVVPRDEYTPEERGLIPPGSPTTMLELDQEMVVRCAWGDAAYRGGACVLVEGSLNCEEPPSASLHCIEGGGASVGRMATLQAALAYAGCPLDANPLDGYSLSAVEPSSGTTEVCKSTNGRGGGPGALL